jgi:hypothetical protein
MGFAPNPYICLADAVDDIQIRGYDIRLVDTNCDAIAKSDRISVSISRSGSSESELILEYDPMNYNRLPSFSVDERGSLSVLIAAVATIFYQKDRWSGGNIIYNIERNTLRSMRSRCRSPRLRTDDLPRARPRASDGELSRRQPMEGVDSKGLHTRQEGCDRCGVGGRAAQRSLRFSRVNGNGAKTL